MKSLYVYLGLAALVAGGIGYTQYENHAEAAPRWRTAKVERGDLVVQVTATGTVQPVTQVQVGTQVSGTIMALNADFNSRVKKGDVVAQLDPASYDARVESDRANLARAEADVARVQALLHQAEREAERMTGLVASELVTASEYEASIANRDSLKAQVKVADATVRQQLATLKQSEVNLKYTTIESPIDGIIVSRNVDVGQTVAASLSAPTLFVIAADLEKMQVQAAVTEADIGRIHSGQPVHFTVDAHPGVTFEGAVGQVRLAPTTVQNVVTYTVLVDCTNPGGRLLPGMTADLIFELDRRDDVLLVSDSALRFTPPTEDEPAGAGSGGYAKGSTSGGSRGGSGEHGRSHGASGSTGWNGDTSARGAGKGKADGAAGDDKPAADAGATAAATTTAVATNGGATELPAEPADPPTEKPGRVWIEVTDGPPRAVDVTVGPSDGLRSAVVAGSLKEGDEVITGLAPVSSPTTATNPFNPNQRPPGSGRPR